MDTAYYSPGATAAMDPGAPLSHRSHPRGRYGDTANQAAAFNHHGIVLPPHSHHQRQQSAPSLAHRAVSSRPQSPIRGGQHQLQEMPLTGDSRPSQRPENSPGRFAAWLGGAPGPDTAVSPNTTPRSKQGAAPTTPKSTPQSRFGFFASSVSAITTRLANSQSPTLASEMDDELCCLDVEAALQPPSSPMENDAFSPAAYKNLQTNATGLLLRMQNAYRQRTFVLREVQAEREAQREETEEYKARIELFKTQLEDMALKASKQEKAMQQLMAQLRAEKFARREDSIMRQKTMTAPHDSPASVFSDADDEEQKVERQRPRRWRSSGETSKSDISSMVDTDHESTDMTESESIFSRSRSPTVMTSATDGGDGLGVGPVIEISGTTMKPNTKDVTPISPSLLSVASTTPTPAKPAQQLSAFQKLVKGISGGDEMGRESSDGCHNCRGQDASVAWDTVSLLRDENKSMKYRVAQLEVAVEGALDLVNGIGQR